MNIIDGKMVNLEHGNKRKGNPESAIWSFHYSVSLPGGSNHHLSVFVAGCSGKPEGALSELQGLEDLLFVLGCSALFLHAAEHVCWYNFQRIVFLSNRLGQSIEEHGRRCSPSSPRRHRPRQALFATIRIVEVHVAFP